MFKESSEIQPSPHSLLTAMLMESLSPFIQAQNSTQWELNVTEQARSLEWWLRLLRIRANNPTIEFFCVEISTEEDNGHFFFLNVKAV